MLYSVEQLPRCDLLRLSPRLGDSSCRLDETPDREKRGRRREEEERGRGEVRLSTARESRRRSSYFAVLSFLSFYLPLLLRITKATRRWRTCAPPAKATRRAGLWFLASYDGESNTPLAYLCYAGESNTPLAYLCYAGESNTPRGDFGFSRATPAKATRRWRTSAPPAKATRRAGTLVSRVLQELKQHAARGLWFLARYAGESNTPLAYLCSAGESNTPRGDVDSSRATRIKATRRWRT